MKNIRITPFHAYAVTTQKPENTPSQVLDRPVLYTVMVILFVNNRLPQLPAKLGKIAMAVAILAFNAKDGVPFSIAEAREGKRLSGFHHVNEIAKFPFLQGISGQRKQRFAYKHFHGHDFLPGALMEFI
jgi:hypothetical protein